MEDIIRQIETAYGISIKSYSQAPRGFWAETYVLITDRDKYFIKIYKDLPFELSLRSSLDIHYQMSKQINYIPKPIKTQNNILLHTLDNKRVAALYTYIDGTKHITNDAYEIFYLMANIYNLKIKCDSIFHFRFYAEEIINKMQIRKYYTKSEILDNFIEHNREVFIRYWNIYKNLVDDLSKKNNKYYLTHGDIAVNLMIDKKKQVFIVDWDRIHLGPVERDLREFIDINTDISKLENIAKNVGLDWRFNKEYHNYFILHSLYKDLFFTDKAVQQDSKKITVEGLVEYQQYIDDLHNKVII